MVIIMLKNYKFYLSILLAIILFIASYPYYHDEYISSLHTGLCIAANAFSSILFAVMLYILLEKKYIKNIMIVILICLAIQIVCHSILVIMNWASIGFLALSAVSIIIMIITYMNNKKQGTD